VAGNSKLAGWKVGIVENPQRRVPRANVSKTYVVFLTESNAIGAVW
jgi:hypothetical protein